jgi:hypothetical protein
MESRLFWISFPFVLGARLMSDAATGKPVLIAIEPLGM